MNLISTEDIKMYEYDTTMITTLNNAFLVAPISHSKTIWGWMFVIQWLIGKQYAKIFFLFFLFCFVLLHDFVAVLFFPFIMTKTYYQLIVILSILIYQLNFLFNTINDDWSLYQRLYRINMRSLFIHNLI